MRTIHCGVSVANVDAFETPGCVMKMNTLPTMLVATMGLSALLSVGCDTETLPGPEEAEMSETYEFRAGDADLEAFCDRWASSPTSSESPKRFAISARVDGKTRVLFSGEATPQMQLRRLKSTSQGSVNQACTNPDAIWVAECERDSSGNASYARLRRSLTNQYVIPANDNGTEIAATRVFTQFPPTAADVQLDIFPVPIDGSPYFIATRNGPLHIEPNECGGVSPVLVGGEEPDDPATEHFFFTECPPLATES